MTPDAYANFTVSYAYLTPTDHPGQYRVGRDERTMGPRLGTVFLTPEIAAQWIAILTPFAESDPRAFEEAEEAKAAAYLAEIAARSGRMTPAERYRDPDTDTEA